MSRWVALLRGVNVGGNRKLPMADLKAFAEDIGLTDVATLLASGNLVFTATGKPDALEATLEREAKSRLGLDTDILVRSVAEIRRVVDANPFPEAASDRPSHVAVLFHRDPVPAASLGRLRESYDGPERFAADGRELYIDYPDGMGRSALGPAMAKLKFPKCATARNWNTVVKLAAMD